MNPVPQPGEPPKTKVMVHGLPGSKFTRQHAPTDAAFEHIKDGIRNLAQINSPLSSFEFRCWKQRLNQRPLRRRQIARIGKLIHPTTILHAFSDRFLVLLSYFRFYVGPPRSALRCVGHKRLLPIRRSARRVVRGVIRISQRSQINWLKFGRLRNKRLITCTDQCEYYCFHMFCSFFTIFLSINTVGHPVLTR